MHFAIALKKTPGSFLRSINAKEATFAKKDYLQFASIEQARRFLKKLQHHYLGGSFIIVPIQT